MRATPDVRLFIMQKNRTGPPGIYHLDHDQKNKQKNRDKYVTIYGHEKKIAIKNL